MTRTCGYLHGGMSPAARGTRGHLLGMGESSVGCRAARAEAHSHTWVGLKLRKGMGSWWGAHVPKASSAWTD